MSIAWQDVQTRADHSELTEPRLTGPSTVSLQSSQPELTEPKPVWTALRAHVQPSDVPPRCTSDGGLRLADFAPCETQSHEPYANVPRPVCGRRHRKGQVACHGAFPSVGALQYGYSSPAVTSTFGQVLPHPTRQLTCCRTPKFVMQCPRMRVRMTRQSGS